MITLKDSILEVSSKNDIIIEEEYINSLTENEKLLFLESLYEYVYVKQNKLGLNISPMFFGINDDTNPILQKINTNNEVDSNKPPFKSIDLGIGSSSSKTKNKLGAPPTLSFDLKKEKKSNIKENKLNLDNRNEMVKKQLINRSLDKPNKEKLDGVKKPPNMLNNLNRTNRKNEEVNLGNIDSDYSAYQDLQKEFYSNIGLRDYKKLVSLTEKILNLFKGK